MQLSTKHLLGIKDLTPSDISLILQTAEQFKEVLQRPVKKVPSLRDIVVVNLFFENSTRTRLSFELAEKRLSADILNFSASSSSVSKGETLIDTVNNILAMKVDVIVMPSVAALPWPAHQAFPTHIDDQEVGPRGHAVYTGWVNAAGLPALALPCAPSSEGLPIGMQLIGRYGADEQLLTLGATYEAAHPWADRWPAL